MEAFIIIALAITGAFAVGALMEWVDNILYRYYGKRREEAFAADLKQMQDERIARNHDVAERINAYSRYAQDSRPPLYDRKTDTYL